MSYSYTELWLRYHCQLGPDEYEIKFVLEITPVLTRVYMQIHVCEPYKNNYNVANPHADNL